MADDGQYTEVVKILGTEDYSFEDRNTQKNVRVKRFHAIPLKPVNDDRRAGFIPSIYKCTHLDDRIFRGITTFGKAYRVTIETQRVGGKREEKVVNVELVPDEPKAA